MSRVRTLFFSLWACVLSAWAAQPVVSNIQATQRAGTKLVDIYYDISDADGDSQNVQVYVSADDGFTHLIPAVTLSGAVGSGVMPGSNRHIVWNAGKDWNGQFVPECKVRIVCSDGSSPTPPPNMVYIPAGSFQMGDSFDEGSDNELPVHTVYVDGFFMDKFEVSGELWNNVRAWGLAHGYSIDSGGAQAPDHPAQDMDWYSAVKWCNARSERDGLTPVYYTDSSQTQVYRTNDLSLNNSCVKWEANGYRLPTEAEWEKAARGSRLGNRYPWGDTIDSSMANYNGSGDPFEGNSTETSPCGYYDGNQTPAGSDMGNGYGLYDMAGNVYEWCWDRYGVSYYGSAGSQDNPHGPDTGTSRIRRGGAWSNYASSLRCAGRYSYSPDYGSSDIGFRCARGQ